MPMFVLAAVGMGGVFASICLVLVDEFVMVPLGHGQSLEMHS